MKAVLMAVSLLGVTWLASCRETESGKPVPATSSTASRPARSLDNLMADLRSEGLPEVSMTAAEELIGGNEEVYSILVKELAEVMKLPRDAMSSRKRYFAVQYAILGLHAKGVFDRKDLNLIIDAIQWPMLISDSHDFAAMVQREFEETAWTEKQVSELTEEMFAKKLKEWRQKARSESQ
ncbi:MAG TPA: hypothetical protein VK956_03490 [Verrucomicrobium sp.]|nr:hypothetical protein [Verrucomicrobium sp.]